jgi:hypothetical protein
MAALWPLDAAGVQQFSLAGPLAFPVFFRLERRIGSRAQADRQMRTAPV